MCESVTNVQQEFRRQYPDIELTTDKSIRGWYKQFQDTGYLCKQKSPDFFRMSDKNVERIRQSLALSP